MAEDLVLLHTFRDEGAAAAAQGELLSAGIHSLLVSDAPAGSPGAGVALAVHRRDAELAATVLSLGAARRKGPDPGGEPDRT